MSAGIHHKTRTFDDYCISWRGRVLGVKQTSLQNDIHRIGMKVMGTGLRPVLIVGYLLAIIAFIVEIIKAANFDSIARQMTVWFATITKFIQIFYYIKV